MLWFVTRYVGWEKKKKKKKQKSSFSFTFVQSAVGTSPILNGLGGKRKLTVNNGSGIRSRRETLGTETRQVK